MHFSLVSKMACGQVLPRIGNFIFPGLEQLRCPLLKLISKHLSWTLSSASELIGTELPIYLILRSLHPVNKSFSQAR